ncbi:TetR/AcrR family transcriptional regulator [Streptomyces nanshensis]|uniref:Transcriptional regulator n=1 Tax=Streptomyces nanshensis TaxID=518642 RepID=A0A1E7KX66_9ACTN|nr:TetR/AcrR family transcriptional regulator [Streptomyces nanshensis]OEV08509.1 transcriptional regulator [Streptomyces nanshensis]
MARGQPADRRERADRILDVTADLLLRWGHRRVTIDEVAGRAGVGKGTVYLHWSGREQIFLAVAAREAAGAIDAVVAAMRADTREVLLHRYMRRLFVEAMQRPVLRAVFTRDAETLDRLLADPRRRPLEGAKLVASREYLGLLGEHGLLRDGLRPEDLDYPLPAVVYGFFASEPLLSHEVVLGLEEKADHVADTLHHAFEPPTLPRSVPRPVAVKAIEIFEQLAREFREVTYGSAK